MLVAIVSDTHLPRGGRRIPDACWQRMLAADHILHAGDFVAREVLGDLEALGPPVSAVRGNMDRIDLVSALPERRVVDLDGARVGMVHDAGRSAGRLERLRGWFPEADAVVFGHSHIPLHEEAKGFQIFNPGSPTDRRRQPAHTMGMARVDGGRIEFELVVLG